MAWITDPETASVSAPVAGGWTWACASQSRRLTQVALSNGRHTRKASSTPPSARDILPKHLFGTTLPLSTGMRGATSATRSSPDTPASHSAARVNAAAKMTSATSGRTSPASSERSAPDGCSSKTWQAISPWGLKQYCATYEKWALTLRPSHSARRKSVPPTNVSESSLWPTAKTTAGGYTRDKGQLGNERLTLQGEAEAWGTPSAGLANYDEPTDTFQRRGEELKARGYPSQGRNLGQQAQRWPTPKALTGGANSKREERGAGGPDLQETAQAWTTPQAHDSKGGAPHRVGRFGTKHGGRNLADDVTSWPTPRSRGWKGSGPTVIRSDGKSRMDQLDTCAEQGFSHQAQTTVRLGGLSFKQRRTLHRLLAEAGLFKRPHSISRPYSPPTRRPSKNPAREAWMAGASYSRWSQKRTKHWRSPRLNVPFVNWLMGWPHGHALSNCSAMAFALWLRQMRGAILPVTSDLHPSIWVPPAKNFNPPEQGSLF